MRIVLESIGTTGKRPVNRAFLLLCVLLASLIGSAPVAAQDELWVTPPTWREDTVIDTDDDRMRDDYLENVTDSTKWPELLAQTTTWRSYVNITRDFNLWNDVSVEPLTDAELEQLVRFTNEQGLLVAFEVGGLRLRAGEAPELAGDNQAIRELQLMERWLNTDTDGMEGGDGRIDFVTPDHPILISFNKMNEDPAIPTMTMADLIRELVDYYVTIAAAIPNVKFGLLEGPTAFEVATEAGYVYPPNSTAIQPPTRFRDFWSDLLAEMATRGLTLDHFLTDAGPQAPRFDGGNDGSWDFGRLIDVERHIQSTGVRHGLLVHPGIDYNMTVFPPEEEEIANRGTYDLVMRYAEEFRAAGGAPDIYAPSSWHNYPTRVGPEDDAFSWMNLARDVVALDTAVRDRVIVPYFSDAFEGALSTADWLTTAGSWGTLGGSLQQTDTNVNARLELADEPMADVAIRTRLQLGAGSGWAGVHFRKQSGDVAWQSGYTVYLRPNGMVSLYAPNAVLEDCDTGVDPTVETVDLRIEAIGDRIRAFANSVACIDYVDSTYSSGLVSLDTVGQAATFEDFQVSRYPEATLIFEDDFADGDVAPWAMTTATWSAATGELENTGSGLEQIRRGPAVDSVRAKLRIRLDATGSGWAGLYLRRGNPLSTPWSGGYSVYLRNDGTVTLFKPQNEIQIVDTEVDVNQFVDLEVVAEDHRLVVSVGGRELINLWDEDFVVGGFGLASLDQKAYFDDVVVESLSE
ncbi:MAG: hypothetical protein AAF560_15255 [Acidobacteriota bacterium]